MANTISLPIDRLPLISLCGYCQTEEGFIHPDRIMDVNVMLYVEKGSFEIIEEDYKLSVPQGNIVFLKQGLHHYGIDKCPKGTKWFFVHFMLSDNSLGQEISLMDDYKYIEGSREQPNYYYRLPKQLTVSEGSSIVSKFAILEHMYFSRDYENRLLMNAYFYQILMDIYRESIIRKHKNCKEEKVSEMIDYLENRKEFPFSSKDLEEYMGLSFKHLNVLFKSVTGVTLQKYHNKIRMNYASKLLLGTSLDISEISDLLGFDSAYYFSNSFKKFYGNSPLRYRKDRVMI